jgi:hypothetical protein
MTICVADTTRLSFATLNYGLRSGPKQDQKTILRHSLSTFLGRGVGLVTQIKILISHAVTALKKS